MSKIALYIQAAWPFQINFEIYIFGVYHDSLNETEN